MRRRSNDDDTFPTDAVDAKTNGRIWLFGYT